MTRERDIFPTFLVSFMTRIDSVSHVVSHIHNHRLIKHDCILNIKYGLTGCESVACAAPD